MLLGDLFRFSGSKQCVKSVRIRSYSGPYFPAFGLNNSEYGLCLKSGTNLNKFTY